MKIAQALLLALVVALWGAEAPDGGKPDDKIAPLVQQLSDDTPAVRDAAAKALTEMGIQVLEPLDKTRKETKDEDLKLRLEMILKKIAETTGVTAQSLATDRELKLPSSRVTLELKDETVEKALKEIAAQTGNRVYECQDAQLMKRRVTLSLKDAPYWEAMRKVMEAGGLYLEPNWNRGMITDRMLFTELSAVAGPMIVTAQSASRSQSTNLNFRRPKEAPPVAEMNQQLYINFQFMTEDRLPVLSVAAPITSVRNTAGTELLPRRDDGRGGEDWGYYRSYGNGNNGAGNTNVSLGQQAATEPGPVSVSGTVNLRLALGTRAVRVEKVFGKDAPADVVSGPYTLKVRSARREGGNAVVEMDVTARSGAPVFHEGARKARFGFSLAFPAKADTKTDTKADTKADAKDDSSAGGFAGADTKADAKADTKDAAETRCWSIGSYEIRSEGNRSSGRGNEDTTFDLGWMGRRGGDGPVSVSLTLTFTNIPDGDDAALVFVGPDHVEQRSYPFTIKDIPLP